jgi:RNA-splicing ligase RtcB
MYANLNRETMATIICQNMGLNIERQFTTAHNYIDLQHQILRKGAVSALCGEELLIPMNMRDGSLLCIGKGNLDWLYSAPHGAGRLMSRRQAVNTLQMDDFEREMKDVYSTSVCPETIDESPIAYKPMQEIIDAISDTVTIVDVIKPLYNFKAKSKTL